MPRPSRRPRTGSHHRHHPVVAAVRSVGLAVVLTTGALVGSVGSPVGASDGRPVGATTVSAAASLAPALDPLAAAFERRYPDTRVRLNYGSSTTLAAQITSGAPADVFAAADRASLRRLESVGAVRTPPLELARNAMTVVVKPGNPRRVEDLADLARLPVVALCAATAPCGRYAARVLDRAAVDLPERRVTRGADATATLGAVATGDADAAVVYRTDARAAGRAVTAVAVPADQNVDVVYRIALLADRDDPAVAAALVRFATSERGRRILARHGFLAP